ncbi:DUF1993 domain-containing protein [Luteibacter aegosomatis]|uniref:DUF1993 domain-containing protein n=1 Tax=Luteibacter aegosomatis TaxID=2911537 RepID=UPI001FF857DE|nr:DUF1993 domain-containing protein [Luteibacter aegosomatis]UPG86243.1 DUF1993 domain-containing protein [Luteibacter aegosomatis]
MSLSMYQASVPVLVRALKALSGVLQKGADFARERNIAPDVLLNTRVIADMFPLARQVQIATDMAKGAAYRLAGQDVPSMADDETTFEQLQERIAKVIGMIEGIEPGRIDGSEAREIVLKMRSGERRFAGQEYLFGYVLPNVYFHATTTYAILRGEGVPLGKADFIG